VSTEARPGEVWLVDFGLAAKVRPVVVLSVPQPADARSLVVVAPLTFQSRRLRGEVDIGKPRWLPKPSAVNVQSLASLDYHALEKKPGRLSQRQFEEEKSPFANCLNCELHCAPEARHQSRYSQRTCAHWIGTYLAGEPRNVYFA
jgi:mRNA interferase MazF